KILPLGGGGKCRREPLVQRPRSLPPAVERLPKLHGQPRTKRYLIGPRHWSIIRARCHAAQSLAPQPSTLSFDGPGRQASALVPVGIYPSCGAVRSLQRLPPPQPSASRTATQNESAHDA